MVSRVFFLVFPLISKVLLQVSRFLLKVTFVFSPKVSTSCRVFSKVSRLFFKVST